MKKIIYIIIGIALLVLAGFKLVDNKQKQLEQTAIVAQKNTTIAVRVDTVSNEIINSEYMSNGNFAPFQDLKLASERGGQVIKVLAQEGSKVAIGQTLAIIKADLQSVELQNAEAAYFNAQKDAQRFESAFSTGGVTQQQLDQTKLQLQSAKARLEQAKINVGDSHIKSTINGIINKKHIEPGTVVAPGAPLFDVVNVSKLKLEVFVPENQVTNIKVGDTVTIKVSVYPNRDFTGEVTFIAAMADESLNFKVDIEVANNSGDGLRAGMYGTAIFGSKETGQAPITTVSRNAFVGSIGNNEIFVVRDGVAHLTKISAGRNFGDKVEVLEGLKKGEIVVVSGIINLTDGAKISVIE